MNVHEARNNPNKMRMMSIPVAGVRHPTHSQAELRMSLERMGTSFESRGGTITAAISPESATQGSITMTWNREGRVVGRTQGLKSPANNIRAYAERYKYDAVGRVIEHSHVTVGVDGTETVSHQDRYTYPGFEPTADAQYDTVVVNHSGERVIPATERTAQQKRGRFHGL